MRHPLLAVAVAAALIPAAAAADPPKYETPPDVIVRMVDALPPPSATLGPDRHTILLATPRTLPSIAEVSAPELRLAGIRVNPRNGGTARRGYLQRLELVDLRAPTRPRVVTGLPAGARISDLSWSPDGRRIALTVTGDDAVALWTVDVATAVAAPLGTVRVTTLLGGPCDWLSDSTGLLCRTVPDRRAALPPAPQVPAGPVILENRGTKKPARTNPDLLTGPHDETLFEHFLTTQLAVVRLDGKATLLGKPDLYLGATPSPDGKHILVETVHRPFSYRVSLDRFPHRIEVWSAAGAAERKIADNPLAEDVPVDFDAVRTGPRDAAWRADADASLCWVEARDGGDPKKVVPVRDELLCLAAPFRGAARSLARLEHRYGGVQWGDGALALVSEGRWKDRKSRTHIIAPDQPKTAARVLWDRSYEDRYSDPGRPALRSTPRGTSVLHLTPARQLLLLGDGASDQGDRPFFDRLDLASGKTERLWRSDAPTYGYVNAIVDDAGAEVLLSRESVSEVPQIYLRSLADGVETQLTHTPHPAPMLSKVEKKLMRYKRKDGLELSAMLYLPPGFKPGKSAPAPVLVWAYPQEFKTASAASQVKGSPHRFIYPSPSGPLFALTQGYVVVDNPAFAIVGEGNTEPNDTYVTQLVSSAQAVIDEVSRLGVGDRDRVAIAGHSYGAFTVANLLAHSDLFRAGIARSGAYNRTLTPFGFQSEERIFWQAEATYIEMSPFTHAQRIDEPILIIHGAVDDNPGTFPIQSERLFQAIQGLGGTARFVSLPAETHGYRARESVLHVLWEQLRWLDEHVKQARPRRIAGGR